MDKNSKIYVAGLTGLAGSAIIRNLKQGGYTNILTRTYSQLDLIRQAEVESFFKDNKPEYVIMAAAKVGGIQANMESPGSYLYDNLMIQNNIIHSAYLYGVKKLLFLSSSCAYPKYAPQPMPEEAMLTGLLEPTNEPYAVAKIAGMKMCDAYNAEYKTNFITIVPPNLYGNGDNYNLDTSHVMPAFIRKIHLARCLYDEDYEAIMEDFHRNQLNDSAVTSSDYLDFIKDKKDFIDAELKDVGITKDSITFWGTGSPKREFMHSDDLATGCVYLMNSVDYHDIRGHLNIGVGGETSLSALARVVSDIICYKGEILWDTSHHDGMPARLLDITKAKALGWWHTIGLESGILDTYNGYLNK